MPALTVVIPCHNESHRLNGLFELIEANPHLAWEWLFVNDGSQDQTAMRIRDFQNRIGKKVTLLDFAKNRGKGHAVREGILAAKGELIGYVDADLAASPLQFVPFLESPALRAGKELIVGVRRHSTVAPVKRHWHRHLLGRGFSFYSSRLVGLDLLDTQCGFKLLAGAPARKIAQSLSIDGFAFDVELLLLARLSGLHLRQERIRWVERANNTIRWHHLLEMARDVHRIWWRHHGKRLLRDRNPLISPMDQSP